MALASPWFFQATINNNVLNNEFGILIKSSSNAIVYLNNYLGNYWSDYAGSDTNNDGIGDTPYGINLDKDNYPLMQPWGNYLAAGPPSIGKVFWASDRSGNWDIWMMNPDGTDLEQLTTDLANGDLPQISPDGKKILFCSDRTGTSQVWMMNSDGSDQVMGINLFTVVKTLIKNKNPCWGLLCR